MSRIAVVAAIPGEVVPLVRGWRHEMRNGVHLWRSRQGEDEWVAACAGAGERAATRAFAEIERDGAVSAVVSVGWAGALGGECKPRLAYWVAGVIDAQTGERFEAVSPIDFRNDTSELGGSDAGDFSTQVSESRPGAPTSASESGLLISEPSGDFRVVDEKAGSLDKLGASYGTPGAGLLDEAKAQARPWLVTSSRVAGVEEKRRLAEAYGAGLVDMEAAAIARLAAMRGIPFGCIKGVSDGHADRLPDFNRFLTPEGQFRLARFIPFAILRPWHWPGLMRMGENSSKASQAIRESLLENLRRPGAH